MQMEETLVFEDFFTLKTNDVKVTPKIDLLTGKGYSRWRTF